MAERIAILWGRGARRAGCLECADLTGDIEADQALLAEPGATPAFRLNSDTGRRFSPDRLAELGEREAMLAALKEEAARQLDLFARHKRRFLDLYFAFIDRRVAAERAALQARLAWSGGLLDHRDWAFSALRPLPRARLAAIEGGRLKPAPAVCDFAFWTGEEALAVMIRGAGKAESLASAGPGPVRHVALAPDDLASVESCFRPERFPPAFLAFWEGEDWPASPFRPRGLEGFAAAPLAVPLPAGERED